MPLLFNLSDKGLSQINFIKIQPFFSFFNLNQVSLIKFQ